MCESSTSQSLPVCARHRLIRWSRLALCGQEGWLWWATSLEEVKEGRRHRSVVVVQGNDSDISCGEGAHPCATDPPPCPTSNMPYYVDLWRWLDSTFNWVMPGPSKDLSLHKIKGGQGVCQTKANSGGQSRSWTETFTLKRPTDRSESKRKIFQFQFVNSSSL